VKLQRTIPPDFFRRCYFTSASALLEDQSGAKSEAELRFGTRDKSIFGSSHWVAKAAYLTLSRAWPRALSFDELSNLRRVDVYADDMPREQDVDANALAEVMYKLVCVDAVSFSLYPRNFPQPSLTKLLASPLARRQSESGTAVVNLLHQSVRLTNDDACRVLQLLDGTRDFEQLVAEVHAWRPTSNSGPIDADDERANVNATRTSVHNFLIQAKKMGLIIE
jgi:hypothetical protein